MNRPMDEYIHHCNVANYARLLRGSPDGPRRRVLLGLLAEEGASARANGWLQLDRTPTA
jgi:hypothetical protein